jgi:hypothetical protein
MARVDLAADVVRKTPEHVAELVEEVAAGKTPANAKRKIEAAKEPVLAEDSVAVKEADAGAASPRLEDDSDQLIYIGIDGRGEGAAIIEGRSYVFYITESRGDPDRRLHVENPRPLETDEFCKTIVKPRAVKLVQETLVIDAIIPSTRSSLIPHFVGGTTMSSIAISWTRPTTWPPASPRAL